MWTYIKCRESVRRKDRLRGMSTSTIWMQNLPLKYVCLWSRMDVCTVIRSWASDTYSGELERSFIVWMSIIRWCMLALGLKYYIDIQRVNQSAVFDGSQRVSVYWAMVKQGSVKHWARAARGRPSWMPATETVAVHPIADNYLGNNLSLFCYPLLGIQCSEKTFSYLL